MAEPLRFEWQAWSSDDRPDDWWERWDNLLHGSGRSHPVIESRWVKLVVRHFGADGLAYVAQQDADGTAIMALVERCGRLRWRCFQPSQAPISLVAFRDGLPGGAHRLQSLLPRLSPIALALDLPCQDPDLSLVCRPGSEGAVDRAHYGTTMAVAGSDFEAYWSTRPKGLRQNVGRYFRRLERDGLAWRLQLVQEPEEMETALRHYASLESAGWKGAAGSAVEAENDQGRFYRDVLVEYAENGGARVYLLWAGDRLIAGRLAIVASGMAVMLKTSYDESLSQYAPGRLITYLALQDMLNDPKIERVEFYTKANRDALEWATEQRELFAVTVFRNSMVMSAASARRLWR